MGGFRCEPKQQISGQWVDHRDSTVWSDAQCNCFNSSEKYESGRDSRISGRVTKAGTFDSM